MAWRLNTFFGCGKLETGGLIIGGLELAWAILSIITAIFGLIGTVIVINDPKTNPDDVSNAKSMIIFLIIFTIASVMNCIVAIFLIVGTKQQNHRYVLVWLIVTFITTLMSLLSNIAWFSIFSFIVFVISIYLYLCIYSLYVKIKEEPIAAAGQRDYGAVPTYA